MSNFELLKNRLSYGTASALIAAMGLLGSTTVSAQDNAAVDDDEEFEEVVVTGSRIKRTSSVDQAVRIDVIGSEEIALRGFTNVIDGIEQLPITGIGTNNQGANTQFGDNTAFPNILNLGTQRTLTLVNNRRFVSANQATVFVPGNANGAQVDLSIYNPALIERTELLVASGGAVYGADAVGGVVNVILKDDYEGVDVTLQGGITEEADGEEFRVSALWGQNYLDGRANLTIGAEYLDSSLVTANPGSFDRLVDAQTEEFLNPLRGGTGTASTVAITGATNPALVPGGVLINTISAPGSLNSTLISDAVRLGANFRNINPLALIGSAGANAGGNALIINNPDALSNTEFPNLAVPLRFLADGNLAPFNFGNVVDFPAETGATIGGDGLPNGTGVNVRSGQERISFNVLGRYDITDNITVKQDFIYSRIENLSSGGPLANTAFGSATAGTQAIPVFIDENPFFNQNNRDIIAGLETQGLQVGDIGGSRALFLSRELSDVTGDVRSGNTSETFRTATTFEGDFVFANRDFSWDVAFIYGRSESDNFATQVLDIEFALATDVVQDANGNAVCRQQTLDAPEAINVRNPGLTFINTGVSLTPTAAQVAACQPLNLFGQGQVSPEAAAFVTTSTDSTNLSQQYLAAAGLSGTILSLPAGDLQFGAQFEYRRESNEFNPGPVFGQGLARNTLGQSSQGVLEFLEGGSEFLIPVFGDDYNLPGFDRFEIEGAVRAVSRTISSDNNPAADNSERATDVTWQVAAKWVPFEEAGLLLRGNFNRSVRSPSVVELVGAGVTGFTGGGDSDFACDSDNIDGGPNPAVRRANCESAFATLGISDLLPNFQIPGGTVRPAAGGSNPFLDNEVSESFSLGFTWQPDFIPGLTIESDYYSVDLENQIALSFQVNSCFDSPNFPNTIVGSFPVCDAGLFAVEAGGQFAPNADPSLGFVIPEINPTTGAAVPATANPGAPADQQAPGNLSFVFFPTINVGAEELRALNTKVSYAFQLSDVFGETETDFGALRVTATGFYLERRTQAPTGNFEEFADDIDGEIGDPKFATRLDVQYNIGKFTHLFQWFRTSSQVIDDTLEDQVDDQVFDFRIPTRDQFNYTVNYQITDSVSASLIVNNLTNTRDFAVSDLQGFDPLGRRFTLRLNAKF
jgi:outer membrane receptor protein involved in Fe transport